MEVSHNDNASVKIKIAKSFYNAPTVEQAYMCQILDLKLKNINFKKFCIYYTVEPWKGVKY